MRGISPTTVQYHSCRVLLYSSTFCTLFVLQYLLYLLYLLYHFSAVTHNTPRASPSHPPHTNPNAFHCLRDMQPTIPLSHFSDDTVSHFGARHRELEKAARDIANEAVIASDPAEGGHSAGAAAAEAARKEPPVALGKIVFKGEKFFWR